ncbi:glycosyltransferase [Thermococcus piezophilus]|uniref:Glycosyltransferase subfamily 4-like N-terminal domain-containing protein n=1 Tax=Thermococcus piezophilus TaxID=1712654 RepID=A0A172WG63_9EURY|nr:glycosyltransferase [Thermococcus piezophilus]ANF22355.1 hypothetical protein A7C91_03565 [Thermococcus piezophilus]
MERRVLMILNNGYINDPRVTAEAESLVRHGYKVRVIAWDRKRQYSSHDIINGVEVIRIRIPYLLDKILPFEILKLPIWQTLAYKKALDIYKNWKFKIIHVHDCPDLLIGVKLKQKIKGILIYDSHEVWNYMVFTNKFPEFIGEVLWRERSMLKSVDVLITVGRGYKKYFLRYVDDVKIIMNAKHPVSSWKRPKIFPLVIVYIGGFNNFRCIKELARSLCKIKYPVVAIIAGPEYADYKVLFERTKECGVKYIGYVPKSQVISLTLNSSVVYYVFNPKSPLYQIGMPNKLFEAITTGRASIAGKNTDSGRFVEEYKIGIVVTCAEEEIKRALEYLIENPKYIVKFGKRAYSIGRKYNWELEEQKLLKIYDLLNTRANNINGDSR